MSKHLFQDEPLHLRAQFLQDNCDGVEELDYEKEYTEEEIRNLETDLKEDTIKKLKLEEKLAEYKSQISEQVKPISKRIGITIEGLRYGQRSVTEKCFKFFDNGMVNFYNAEGTFISTRPMRPEERQKTIFSVNRNDEFKTGTDNF